ncbi:MAG TPA: hypothetical protein VGN11_02275, partial [Candidatus Baltobacteraceae bacterium]|nr:hypothetical protein [Candidatus Baltobacteraceae bacterium]
MSAKRRPTAKVAAFLAFVVAVLCPQGSVARFPKPARGHLYALSPANNAVYRFPLAQDGLPAKQPDSALYLEARSRCTAWPSIQSGTRSLR